MPAPLSFVVITGLSGAGKSFAIKCFEDMGFFCVDNLPTTLIPTFADLIMRSEQPIHRVALGVDVREGAYLSRLLDTIRELRTRGHTVEVLFLEASEEALVRRYHETRRRHPLAGDGNALDGIRAERKALSDLREVADRILDTTALTVHQLKDRLVELYVAPKARPGLATSLVSFWFGVHNHQPIGNFDHVMVDATERAYRPFLERLDQRPEVRLSVHWTGSLLEWLRERSPRTFDLLGTLAARGQVELLTGGFYEPILAVLPDHDKIGQIERLTTFLKSNFGVRPRGMWLAERVWEPQLPRVLCEAGVEYVLVDDRHFALAGLDVDTLAGYYLTDEQGQSLRVFPINQRLRYLIPFAGVDEVFEYLAAWRGRAPAITMVDDGEKFGAWPGTYARVYEEGWLDRFFDRLLSTPWLEPTTLADVVERVPASGRVYLPTASYGEMGEWALSADAGRALEAAKAEISRLTDGERLAGLLRGGFWRSFLVKYPEVGDAYWKMLRLSRAIHAAVARP